MASKKSVTYFGALAGSFLALAASMPAQAATFTAQDAVKASCVGQTSCTVNGFFTLDATGKQITQKTVGGVTGLGVATDGTKPKADESEGEIDLGEALKVTFKQATILESLDLSFLYKPGVYEDQIFEIGLVTPFGGSPTPSAGTLTVTGNTTAQLAGFSGGATYQNLSPSVTNSGGSYRINNPFAQQLITGFILTPKKNGTATSYRNSDLALSAVTVRTVPEPGMVAALFGVGTLVSLKLRRKANLV